VVRLSFQAPCRPAVFSRSTARARKSIFFWRGYWALIKPWTPRSHGTSPQWWCGLRNLANVESTRNLTAFPSSPWPAVEPVLKSAPAPVFHFFFLRPATTRGAVWGGPVHQIAFSRSKFIRAGHVTNPRRKNIPWGTPNLTTSRPIRNSESQVLQAPPSKQGRQPQFMVGGGHNSDARSIAEGRTACPAASAPRRWRSSTSTRPAHPTRTGFGHISRHPTNNQRGDEPGA